MILGEQEQGMSISQLPYFEKILKPRKSNHYHQLTGILFMVYCAIIRGETSSQRFLLGFSRESGLFEKEFGRGFSL